MPDPTAFIRWLMLPSEFMTAWILAGIDLMMSGDEEISL